MILPSNITPCALFSESLLWLSVTVLGPTGLLSAHSKNVGVYCVRCSRSTCVYLCILRYSTNSHSWVLYILSSLLTVVYYLVHTNGDAMLSPTVSVCLLRC